MKFYIWRSGKRKTSGVYLSPDEPKAKDTPPSNSYDPYWNESGINVGWICRGAFLKGFGALPEARELWVLTDANVEKWEWDRHAPSNV